MTRRANLNLLFLSFSRFPRFAHSAQVQTTEENSENDESDDDEAYQEQLAIDVEIDRVAITNMINKDPDINAKRPFGTLQSEQESASNKTPRLQRNRRDEN